MGDLPVYRVSTKNLSCFHWNAMCQCEVLSTEKLRKYPMQRDTVVWLDPMAVIDRGVQLSYYKIAAPTLLAEIIKAPSIMLTKT